MPDPVIPQDGFWSSVAGAKRLDTERRKSMGLRPVGTSTGVNTTRFKATDTPEMIAAEQERVQSLADSRQSVQQHTADVRRQAANTKRRFDVWDSIAQTVVGLRQRLEELDQVPQVTEDQMLPQAFEDQRIVAMKAREAERADIIRKLEEQKARKEALLPKVRDEFSRIIDRIKSDPVGAAQQLHEVVPTHHMQGALAAYDDEMQAVAQTDENVKKLIMDEAYQKTLDEARAVVGNTRDQQAEIDQAKAEKTGMFYQGKLRFLAQLLSVPQNVATALGDIASVAMTGEAGTSVSQRAPLDSLIDHDPKGFLRNVVGLAGETAGFMAKAVAAGGAASGLGMGGYAAAATVNGALSADIGSAVYTQARQAGHDPAQSAMVASGVAAANFAIFEGFSALGANATTQAVLRRWMGSTGGKAMLSIPGAVEAAIRRIAPESGKVAVAGVGGKLATEATAEVLKNAIAGYATEAIQYYGNTMETAPDFFRVLHESAPAAIAGWLFGRGMNIVGSVKGRIEEHMIAGIRASLNEARQVAITDPRVLVSVDGGTAAARKFAESPSRKNLEELSRVVGGGETITASKEQRQEMAATIAKHFGSDTPLEPVTGDAPAPAAPTETVAPSEPAVAAAQPARPDLLEWRKSNDNAGPVFRGEAGKVRVDPLLGSAEADERATGIRAKPMALAGTTIEVDIGNGQKAVYLADKVRDALSAQWRALRSILDCIG